jgi:hypothetical protein
METPYKISSRALLPPALWTGKFTIECPCPDAFRPYTILSHTWGEGEVSFQELQSGTGESKAGYDKIRGCCEIAASDGFEYALVDTCCIDKTSSAELSETINSMYSWYRLSDVCYVYLADVLPNLDAKARDEAIRKSRWFTRGWTLQELIAPSSVIFYDSHWCELGTKDSLETLISDTTGIDGAVLQDADKMESFTVAQRMSWASMRVTTRVEDIAYCLLGIFGVHMPMLYGEGDYAFVRLQEEIMRTTADNSIFAWTRERAPYGRQGLLALTPAWFRRSGSIVCTPDEALAIRPFSVTNRGIHLYLPTRNTATPRICLAVLNCHKNGETMTQLGIYLTRQSEGSDIFERSPSDSLGEVERATIPNLDQENIFVRQERRPIRVHSYDRLVVSMAGLRNSVFAFKGVTPLTWRQSGNLFGFLCSKHSPDKEFFSAFAFSEVNSDYGFVDILKHGRLFGLDLEDIFFVLSAKIVDRIIIPGLNLNSFQSSIPPGGLFGFRTGPISWQHPVRKWWIDVTIKKQVVQRERTIVVHIGWHTPDQTERSEN